LEDECPAEKNGKVIRSITTNGKKDCVRIGTRRKNNFLKLLF